MKVEIKELAKAKLKNPVIIEGFPGIGMVGTIGASYLSEHMQLKLIGCFSSSHFPPIASIHNYIPVSPARIYASEKYDLVVLFSEFVIPAEIVFALSQKIIEFAKDKKARAIYSLAGIATEQPDGKIYGIVSTAEMAKALGAKGIEIIREGATQGVSGVLIAECASEKIPAANIMVQTAMPLDPAGSARLLDKLAEITGIPFDTKELTAEGEKIEGRMKAAMEKMKEMHKGYEEFTDNPMYG